MLHGLAAPLLATALVAWRPPAAPPAVQAPAPPVAQHVAGCDDGADGGSLVQRGDTWYGNRLALACPSGRLTAVEFTYFGAGLPGPYAYRLHFLDAACRTLGSTSVVTVPGAPDAPATTTVDVAALGVCVSTAFAIVLEPLSCADGAAAGDCMPALVVDGSSDAQETAHCGVVSTSTSGPRECLAPRSSDGRYFDFRLRAQVDCAAAECATPVAPAAWSRLKRLYR